MDKKIADTLECKTGSTRRELLNYVWLASLGILTAAITGIGVSYSLPRFRKGAFGGVIDVGPVTELPSSSDPPINYPKGKFWLVRTEQGLIALYKACTHLDCLFDWNQQEGKFICPCHGSQFDRNGTLISGPAPRSLDQFVVQIVSSSGKLLAETDPQSGLNAPILDFEANTKLSEEMSSEQDVSKIITPTILSNNPAEVIIRVDTSRKIIGT